MGYTIPVSGCLTSPHFGHCEYFALIDADENARIIIRKEPIP